MNQPKSKMCLFLTFVLSFLFVLPAQAQRFSLDLDNPDFIAYPIAVTDLVNSQNETMDELGGKIGETLRTDLEIGGFFSSISPKAFLAPKTEPWTNPDYQAWFNIKASGLVRGAYTISGDTLRVTFRLYDVDKRKEVKVSNFEEKISNYRTIAHRYADELHLFFTGERSIFSTKIAYVTVGAKGGKDIHICDFDGQNDKAVISNGQLNLMPAWAADGQSIFYTVIVGDENIIYNYNLNTASRTKIVGGKGLYTGIDVSPDGKKIAFTSSRDGNREVYSADVNGGNIKRLTNQMGEDLSAHWSNDGKQLVFVSNRSGNPQLYFMNADGTNQKRITFQGNYNTEPDWSPVAGGKIVFSARDERNMYDIFMVEPTTTVINRLTQDEGHNNEAPSFSPDGRHIVFTSNRGGKGSALYIMHIDGTGQRLIKAAKGNIDSPSWSPIF